MRCMSHGRRRILYLAFAWPHEKSSGYNLRTLQVARALKEVGEVSLAVASQTDGTAAMEKAASEFQICCSMRVKTLGLHGLRERVRWAFDPSFFNLYGWVGEEQGKVVVRESLPHFDLVWIGGLRVANVFELWHWPRTMLDIDDVPSAYELTKWRSDRRLRDRFKAGCKALAWKRREKSLLERFTLLGVCSEADRRYLGGGSRIHVIPNGFERPTAEPRRKFNGSPRIGFIGPFGYKPNLEGIRWFMRSCWARIKRDVPDVRLRLVGKDTDGPLKPAGPDVDGLGWLADPSEEIATWSTMIVPIRVGGGTRLKVAEALSRKCPLVSTRLGAFGYDLVAGKEILLADTAPDFARACIDLIREPVKASEMTERAWHRFLASWTWDAIAPSVWAAAEHCLRMSDGGLDRAGGVLRSK
jgi:glycosyltransferase involved in cell wall biosynthesis